MSFSPAQLLHQLAHCPATRRYWIAYSGGMDSHVLLHAMVQLRDQLHAELQVVHINHQLQQDASHWQRHCRQICADYAIPLIEISVDASATKGDSPEAAARDARYRAFAELLQDGDGLLLAQHKNDQAETLFLQLLRGSGPSGLSAMPLSRPFAKGWLGRPLLPNFKDELAEYARQEGLNWIEDPSNANTDFDRNFLRQNIFPALRDRWPAVDSTLARVATYQAEASQLSQQIAERDWLLCQGDAPGSLAIEPFLKLTPAEQNNLLRYWITHIHGVRVPDTRRLARIRNEIIPAADDAQPCITWPGAEVRRYKLRLYLLKDADQYPLQPQRWDLRQSLQLHPDHILKVETKAGQGVKASLIGRDDLRVAFRRGGETCRPENRGHTHRLKNLFQEWQVPPWRRDRIPLLYLGDQMVAVVGYCVCEPFQARADETGIIIKEQTDKPL